MPLYLAGLATIPTLIVLFMLGERMWQHVDSSCFICDDRWTAKGPRIAVNARWAWHQRFGCTVQRGTAKRRAWVEADNRRRSGTT